MKLEFNGWIIEIEEDDTRHVWVSQPNHPGHINIMGDSEGYVVDIWSSKFNDTEASTYALYSDLDEEEEAV